MLLGSSLESEPHVEHYYFVNQYPDVVYVSDMRRDLRAAATVISDLSAAANTRSDHRQSISSLPKHPASEASDPHNHQSTIPMLPPPLPSYLAIDSCHVNPQATSA